MLKSLALLVAVLALSMFVVQPTLADDTHEGKVVKIEPNKLTMTSKDGGKDHSHIIGRDVKITLDGKDCKLEDLKPGNTVKVTTKDKDRTTVLKVEATTKDK